jgi:hypothetical protein
MAEADAAGGSCGVGPDSPVAVAGTAEGELSIIRTAPELIILTVSWSCWLLPRAKESLLRTKHKTR